MRILIAHNSYLQPGGEDVAFEAESDLLRSRGHTVLDYSVHNDQIATMGQGSLAARTMWNRRSFLDIRELIQREQPDVLHLHNTFPLLSPSVTAAARQAGIPVVHTLHNYRLVCPNAQLFRAGQPCHDCLNRFIAWPGVVHRCYRQSRAASAVVALSILEQRVLRRWGRAADVYVTLTHDALHRLVEAGLPANRLVVKPNFLAPDPGFGRGAGGYAIFVGRLSPEKGVLTLLDAWSRLEAPVTLKIVGNGPLEPAVERSAAVDSRIHYLGWRERSEVIRLLKDAAVMIFPSQWYEGLPQAIVEALAAGTPVIASRLGAMRELVCDGESGLHVEPGDPNGLVDQVNWAYSHPIELSGMRSGARIAFESNFTAERNYDLLMAIYARAREHVLVGDHLAASVSTAPTD